MLTPLVLPLNTWRGLHDPTTPTFEMQKKLKRIPRFLGGSSLHDSAPDHRLVLCFWREMDTKQNPGDARSGLG